MNILGVDFGKKRIGLAWVDTAIGAPLPYCIVQNSTELADLIQKERIQKVVIGLPVGLDGKENENTKIVRRFAEELRQAITAPIELIDERFTSAQADRMGGDASRDEKAAMLILQTYIDRP